MSHPKDTKDVEVPPCHENTPLLGAKDLFCLLNCTGLDVLAESFGHRLLTILFCSQHLMKGSTKSFTGSCQDYLFASYNVPASKSNIYSGVITMPGALKPMIGLLSDALPIFGYKKSPYMLLSVLAGIYGMAVIGLEPKITLSMDHLVVCLFLMELQFSTCDLLTEANYANRLQEQPHHGPALVSFVWGGIKAGSLVAIALSGSVMSVLGFKAMYLMAIVPSMAIIGPLLFNYMEEQTTSHEEHSNARAKLFEQREACLLCLLMLAGAGLLLVMGMTHQSVGINAAAALTVFVDMLTSFSLALRPAIAKINAFLFILQSAALSIKGTAFYFYTDTPEMYPEGPHFSVQFYTSVVGCASTVFSLVGVWAYSRYAYTWSYRRIFLSANLLQSLLSFIDLVFFARLNTRVGLPDHVFILGSTACESLVTSFCWMPSVVVLSQLCPKGMEAIMFALLAGAMNLAQIIASSFGAVLLHWLGCEPSGRIGESRHFDNLWLASAISMILSMLPLLLVPVLLPEAQQTELLLQDDVRNATSGSLWRRWRDTSPAAPGD